MKPENETSSPSSEAPPLSPLPPSARRRSRATPWVAVALAAVALAVWQWVDNRNKMNDLRQQVERRLAESERAWTDARAELKTANERVTALQSAVGALEARVGEFQAQGDALKTLNQDLARSREEATLLEVEQEITLAAQQLQLAGNVPVAILALQTADSRLARLDRPQYLPLRKALAKDLGRLGALPVVDLAGISLRLEQVILGVDKLPLNALSRPRPTAPPAAAQPAPASWWEGAGESIWRELKGLVRIQRFDREDPALLAPGQEHFLRENLKLRLLNARLALYARDQATFRNELKVAEDWLGRYFEAADKGVDSARNTLRQMTAAEINVELPNLNDTQSALHNVRPGKDKR